MKQKSIVTTLVLLIAIAFIGAGAQEKKKGEKSMMKGPDDSVKIASAIVGDMACV